MTIVHILKKKKVCFRKVYEPCGVHSGLLAAQEASESLFRASESRLPSSISLPSLPWVPGFRGLRPFFTPGSGGGGGRGVSEVEEQVAVARDITSLELRQHDLSRRGWRLIRGIC